MAKHSDKTVDEVLEQRRESFEEKRENRVERYEDLAQAHSDKSVQRWQAGSRMFDGIPMGQPILVGHHSESRDRRYRERAGNNLSKSIEHSKTAEYYAEKADSAKSNTSISSDDPDALQKLEEKLAGMEERQALMKRVNSCIRSKGLKQLPEEEKAAYISEKTGVSTDVAIAALAPDYAGRVGFPKYKLQNNNGNMRRVRQRITEIKAQHKDISEHGESREVRHDDLGMTVIFNYVENRLQLDFDAVRIDKSIYELLTKQHAFRKTREGIYQRQLNQGSEPLANRVVSAIRESQEA